jgi:hypothetical protein
MNHMKMLRSTFLALAAITLIGVGPARAMSSPLAAGKTTSVKIYLVAIGDNGKAGKKIGCGDSLIAVTRPITPTTTPLTAALRVLLSDHHRVYGQSGLYNALYQSRLTVNHVTIRNGRATIYLTGRMQLGGVCDDPRVGAQLRSAAFQFPTVHSVAIFVNGIPLKRRLSER